MCFLAIVTKKRAIDHTYNHIFVSQIFVHRIVLNANNARVTMEVSFGQRSGVTSPKLLFCQTDELGTMIMGSKEDGDVILSSLVEILSKDEIDGNECVNVEEVLGYPLLIQGRRIEVYHPFLKWTKVSMRKFIPDFYMLNSVIVLKRV